MCGVEGGEEVAELELEAGGLGMGMEEEEEEGEEDILSQKGVA